MCNILKFQSEFIYLIYESFKETKEEIGVQRHNTMLIPELKQERFPCIIQHTLLHTVKAEIIRCNSIYCAQVIPLTLKSQSFFFFFWAFKRSSKWVIRKRTNILVPRIQMPHSAVHFCLKDIKYGPSGEVMSSINPYSLPLELFLFRWK